MKNVIFAITLLLLITSAGCKSADKTSYLDNGLPKKEYLIGGGFIVDFVVPQDGTAYLVLRNKNKIVQTSSLKKGDHFTFGSNFNPETIDEYYFGVPTSDAVIDLYFVPLTKNLPTIPGNPAK